MNNSHLLGRKRPEQMSAIHAPLVTASILRNKHSHHCDSNHEFLYFIRFSLYLSSSSFYRLLVPPVPSYVCTLSQQESRGERERGKVVKSRHTYEWSGRIFTARRSTLQVYPRYTLHLRKGERGRATAQVDAPRNFKQYAHRTLYTACMWENRFLFLLSRQIRSLVT